MNIKALITGALIGSVVGFFIGTWYVEEYMPVFDFEDDELLEEQEEENPKEKMVKKVVKKKRGNSNKTAPVRNYSEYFESQNRPDLAALASKYNDDLSSFETPPLEEDLWDDSTEDMDEIKTINVPFVMTLDDYANSDYAKRTLLYYTEDDVLCDEADTPILDYESFLGTEALVSFGQWSGDPDVVYICNGSLRACYEVVRQEKNYGAVIHKKAEAKMKRQPKLKVMENDES